MGSTTYEWILDHEFGGKDPAEWKWPYDVPCWVFTHRQLPAVPDARIAFTSAAVAAVHEQMVRAAGDRNAPVTLGGGAPLLPRRIELRLDELGRNGDFVGVRFSVLRRRPRQATLGLP